MMDIKQDSELKEKKSKAPKTEEVPAEVVEHLKQGDTPKKRGRPKKNPEEVVPSKIRYALYFEPELYAKLERLRWFREAKKQAQATAPRYFLNDMLFEIIEKHLSSPAVKAELQQADTMHAMLFEGKETHICPKCGKEYSGIPANSREGLGDICPDCGLKEGLEAYAKNQEGKKE